MAILKYHRAETAVSPYRDYSLIVLKLLSHCVETGLRLKPFFRVYPR